MRERGEERVIRWVLIIGRLVEDRLLVPLRRHKPSPWDGRRSSSPPQEDERGREREREKERARRDAREMREGATAGAMRIGLISNSQTRRNRYISRRYLSIGGLRLSPDTPRYLSRRG